MVSPRYGGGGGGDEVLLNESMNVVLVCDRTSTISYSMFFKGILKF